MPSALITGIAGQDGSYLAELLLHAGYTVTGLVRDNTLLTGSSVKVVRGDLRDPQLFRHALEVSRPDEVYNLAAIHPASHEPTGDPATVAEVNALSVARMLETVDLIDPTIRFFQASSAQIYGWPRQSPQTEETPCFPDTPYGIAKLYAQQIARHYRNARRLFVCSGILFNHESPRRAEKFVTRKITLAVARIKAGLQERLILEDLEARRDWGYAADYARAMWQMMQAPVAGDYVIATGETHSVREFCQLAFEYAGLDYRDHVVQRTASRQPKEPALVGDASKAWDLLGWRPRLPFEQLVRHMVEADIERVGRLTTEDL